MKIKSHGENNGISLDLRLDLDPWVIKKRVATRIEAIKNGVRVTVWDWETVKKSIALQTVAKLRELRLY